MGLASLTVEKVAAGLQAAPGNELAGLEGRTELLIRLGKALHDSTEFFGSDGRPGNMIGMSNRKASQGGFTSHAADIIWQTISYHIHQRRHNPFSLCRCQFCGTFS